MPKLTFCPTCNAALLPNFLTDKMEAQLSMDLDSIIAANKASRRSQQASKGNSNGGRGARGGAGRADRDRPAARNSAPAYNTRQQQPTPVPSLSRRARPRLELFGRTGRIKKVQLFYDRNGKSTGTGHVQYASKEDALAAIKRYNGVQLDGTIAVCS
ncbi:hypothetical protein BCR44DRAFT_1463532 [Catenaria anguillulae PL171]|uniref:RRM domain-containing protein n=1 Tax=Catenaria anguillulae PL171 TaxID=765915 RepID=A0A1Y2HCY6_9FUNG|nr:hypothetical protein BCR44DRAFT_1463532 [Catenaria anguillulae PL171]